MTTLGQQTRCCARCRSWAAEPAETLKATGVGALLGWCQNPHIWAVLKGGEIVGEKKPNPKVGVRTAAESLCPLFFRR